jgi:hypothetical protein
MYTILRTALGNWKGIVLLAAFILLTGNALADENFPATRLNNSEIGDNFQLFEQHDSYKREFTPGADGRAPYFCQLKVYIVEPISRYRDNNGINYEFGFLDFAIDTALNLQHQIPFNKTVTWDPDLNEISGGISESNIKVIAVFFNHIEGFPQYSYIQPGYPVDDPFVAYHADACAAAEPGETGYNEVAGGYTHTVFLEEATWDG